MRFNRSILALAPIAAAGMLAGCAPQPPPGPLPTPGPAPTLAPAQMLEPPPILGPEDAYWDEHPASSGDWFYAQIGNFTYASFGSSAREPVFSMRCEPATGTVSLGYVSDADEPRPMRFQTETATREFTAVPRQGSVETLLAVDLRADDPLLDAIALSKGRFAVAAGGEPVLYIPAWTEISRVIEDCR